MIFLSYRRADAADMAGRIRDRLNPLFPKQIFLDVQDISPGTDFKHKIEATISSCKVLVLLIGETWLTSSSGKTRLGDDDDVVTQEILCALRHEVPIIPVLVNEASMPDEVSLPPPIDKIRRLNFLEVRYKDFDDDIRRLSRSLYAHLGLRAPTALERFLEDGSARMGFPDFTIGEKQRAQQAFVCLGGGICLLLFSGILWVDYDSTPFFPMGDFIFGMIASVLLFVFAGFIGLNSSKYRLVAQIGMGLCLLAFCILYVLFTLGSEDMFTRQMRFFP